MDSRKWISKGLIREKDLQVNTSRMFYSQMYESSWLQKPFPSRFNWVYIRENEKNYCYAQN